MDIKFKKWFTNGDKTRYKVVLPSSDFTNLPTREVAIGLEFQVIKGDGGYRLSLFGERRLARVRGCDPDRTVVV